MTTRHHKTLTLQGKTWVYYQGDSNGSFAPLIHWCAGQAKGVVVFGSANHHHDNDWIMPFVFSDPNDAMRFKLSF